MIATLTGKIAEKIGDSVIVDVQGVGYGVLMTTEDYGLVTVGTTAKVYVYEHIREVAHDLFAFINLDTKRFFEQLLGVNGVGPKMALNVLSIGSANDVRQAIATANVKYIQQASGVGKRVAERIVVDLKDKVGLAGVDLAATGILQSDVVALQDEAAQALVALGYSAQDAAKALTDVSVDLPLEERIKRALSRK